MPSQDNQLKRLQDVIVEQLKKNDKLGSVPIIPETKGDLDNEIEIGLGQMGLCLVVQTVTAGISNPNLSKPVFDSIAFTVEIWEDVMMNRKITALEAAVTVHEQLYHFRPVDVEGFSGKVINPAPAPRTITPAISAESIGYYANFTLGKAE